MTEVCWCVACGSQVRVCFGARADAEAHADRLRRQDAQCWVVRRVEYTGPYPPFVRDLAALAQEPAP
jgi:hypothetical protein